MVGWTADGADATGVLGGWALVVGFGVGFSSRQAERTSAKLASRMTTFGWFTRFTLLQRDSRTFLSWAAIYAKSPGKWLRLGPP